MKPLTESTFVQVQRTVLPEAIAIQLGLTSGDAKTEYEAGVRSSMTELGVPGKQNRKLSSFNFSKLLWNHSQV